MGQMIMKLKLRDLQGRRVRAKEVKGLKIRVWTQNRKHYLTFHAKDVNAEGEYDYLVMPYKELKLLEPGILIYRYRFDGPEPEDPDENRLDPEATVVSDRMWNPVKPYKPEKPDEEEIQHFEDRWYKNLENLKDLINKEYEGRAEADGNINKRIDELDEAIAAIQELKREDVNGIFTNNEIKN